jgi:hypothetical protein
MKKLCLTIFILPSVIRSYVNTFPWQNNAVSCAAKRRKLLTSKADEQPNITWSSKKIPS